VIAQGESVLLRDRALPFFDDLVDKFLDPAAMHANDVIMMHASFQFKDSLAALKVMTANKSRRLELGKGTINCGQPDLFPCLKQLPVDSLGSQVMPFNVFEEFEHFEPGQGGLQTRILEMFRLVHGVTFQMFRKSSCQKPVAIANENDYHSQKSPWALP
jgi:hypothetical protein